MQLQILSPDDKAWAAIVVDGPHDFYHLPEYVRLEALRLGGRAIAVSCEEDGLQFFVPLILRTIPFGESSRADAISPYGYPTPLIRGKAERSAESLGRLVQGVVDGLRQLGVIAAFVRLHPLIPISTDALNEVGNVVDHGETVWLDLRQDRSELWRQTRMSERNRYSKLVRSGVNVFMDEDWNHFDEFVAIYEETMERLAADTDYFFGKEYFASFREALQTRVHLCVVTLPDGQVGSAGLFTECSGVVQFHLSGTASSCLRLGLSRMMIHYVRDWAKARGAWAFHLGGGVGAKNDSLMEFKRGFSKLRSVFSTWRVVVDPDAYEHAVRFRQRIAIDAGEKWSPNEGFFPAYRS